MGGASLPGGRPLRVGAALEQEGDSLCCSLIKTFGPDVVSVLLQWGSVHSNVPDELKKNKQTRQQQQQQRQENGVYLAEVPVLIY